MIHQINQHSIRWKFWDHFYQKVIEPIEMNAKNITEDLVIDPIIFTRVIQDKHFQLSAIRKELWK